MARLSLRANHCTVNVHVRANYSSVIVMLDVERAVTVTHAVGVLSVAVVVPAASGLILLDGSTVKHVCDLALVLITAAVRIVEPLATLVVVLLLIPDVSVPVVVCMVVTAHSPEIVCVVLPIVAPLAVPAVV